MSQLMSRVPVAPLIPVDFGPLVTIFSELQVATIARDLPTPEQGSPPNTALEAVTEHVVLPRQFEIAILIEFAEWQDPTLNDGQLPVGVPKLAKSIDVTTEPRGQVIVATAFSATFAQTESPAVEASDGMADGVTVGAGDGKKVGLVGEVGTTDGLIDGIVDGHVVGKVDGVIDGFNDGFVDGILEGEVEGIIVGT